MESLIEGSNMNSETLTVQEKINPIDLLTPNEIIDSIQIFDSTV